MSYIVYLAIASAAMGIVVVLVVIIICQHYGIDVSRNLWVSAIPVVLSLCFNVLVVEFHDRCKKK